MNILNKFICSIGVVSALVACSAEEQILQGNSAEDVYKQRTDALMAIDFTTLFTYSNLSDAQQQIPLAFYKVIEQSRQMLQIEKGSTEAVLRVVVQDGKCILWAEHYLDTINGRMVGSINKKSNSYNMFIGTRDKYPELYAEVTSAMANHCNKLGSYADVNTNAAINHYLYRKLNNLKEAAEFRIRVTDNSAEVYVLK